MYKQTLSHTTTPAAVSAAEGEWGVVPRLGATGLGVRDWMVGPTRNEQHRSRMTSARLNV